MTDLAIAIGAAIGAWLILITLFVLRKQMPKQTNEWSERKRNHFPIGGGNKNV